MQNDKQKQSVCLSVCVFFGAGVNIRFTSERRNTMENCTEPD